MNITGQTSSDHYELAKKLGRPATASALGEQREGYVHGQHFYFLLGERETRLEVETLDRKRLMVRY